jgi:ATP-binding protein involved in chromosome partitioning
MTDELNETRLAAPSPDEPVSEAPAPPPSAADVEHMLAGVHDPELGLSIVELGMLKGVSVDDAGNVNVRIALTTAACPLRGQIQTDVASKVRGLPGVADVTVDYAEMSQTERSELMQRARRHAADHAPTTAVRATTRVIAVASGKGGVGKSSVTVNLAAALAERGFAVGVLDADIWGFSVPRLLGVASRLSAKKVDGKGMIVPEELRINAPGGQGPASGGGVVRVVSMGLLVDDEDTALMWRGLILAKALEQFLTDVDWGDLDYLLVDMPPGTGDIQMALSRLLPQAELLVVTTPAKNAQKVAARVTDMARRSYLKVLGVVENMSEFVAPDGTRHEIFGSGGGKRLAALTGAPLVAQIPVEPAVSVSGDEGRPVVSAAPDSAAAQAVRKLAERIATELLPPVEMAGCTARLDDVFAKLHAT